MECLGNFKQKGSARAQWVGRERKGRYSREVLVERKDIRQLDGPGEGGRKVARNTWKGTKGMAEL